MKEHIYKVGKFLAAGVLAALTEYGSFLIILHIILLPATVANLLSYGMGLCVSFTMNRYWVFNESKGHSLARQLVGYGTLVVCNILATTILLTALQSQGIVPEIGKLIVMVCVALWNFFLFRYVIFRV